MGPAGGSRRGTSRAPPASSRARRSKKPEKKQRRRHANERKTRDEMSRENDVRIRHSLVWSGTSVLEVRSASPSRARCRSDDSTPPRFDEIRKYYFRTKKK